MKQNPFLSLSVVAGLLLTGAAVAVSQQGPASPEGVRHAEALSMTFRDVARSVLPAVVSIETRAKVVRIGNNGDAPQMRSPFDDEFFRRFFGDQIPDIEQFRQMPNQGAVPQQRGSGSGFIVDGSGVILTNAHVVNGADRVTVTLYDGREFEATEWHADGRSDVAIIRIDAGELPSVSLGDSRQMEIGDWVLALGNPFNIGTTVTSGIISAKGVNAGINEVESYLQTDAAINPGNSGGPLVNLQGEVVGINTAISTRSGGYDGVGFAIPATTARWVSDQLIAHGEVRRAYLGVQLQQMSAELRNQFGVRVGEGTLVNNVYEDSPADKAGIETGDVVLSFNGQPVKDSAHLQSIVERLQVDQSYNVVVLRNGERKTLTVHVKEMPRDFTPALKRTMRHSPSAEPEESSYDALGLEVQELDKEAISRHSLPDGAEGVLIRSIQPGSPASLAGLRQGDVIEKVGTDNVRSTDEFASAVEDKSLDQGVVLLVRRGNNTHFVVIKSDD